MLHKITEVCRSHKTASLAIALAVSLVLYAVGIKFVLLITLPLVMTMGMRFPFGLKSFLSRLIVSILFLYSIIQIAATLQFLVAPSSDFRLLALFLTLFVFLAIVLFPANVKYSIKPLVSRNDLYALTASAVFAIPMIILICFGSADLLTSLGGIQGIDGVNHFASISEISQSQHFGYTVGNYYPNGFHISTAFIQTGFGIIQSNFSWLVTTKFYFLQYALFGSLLLYGLYYLVTALKRSLFKTDGDSIPVNVGTALSIGLLVAGLYYATFMYHGFLSYFYICAAIVFGLLYLFDTPALKLKNLLGKGATHERFTLASLFLLLSLGASMSWPLWTPPLLLTALAFVLYGISFDKKTLRSWQVAVFVLMAVFHMIPIYFQLKYSGGDGSQGINLTGGLRTFHVSMLDAGMVGLLALAIYGKVREQGRYVLLSVFIPMLVLVSLTICMQYFAFAEVRYYSIKTSLFIEILLLVTAIAFISTRYASLRKSEQWQSIIVLPLLLFMGTALLLGVGGGNPFQDARLLVRSKTTEVKPAYFDTDTKELSELGEQEKIKEANVISLHVSDSGKLYTHMQLFYWTDIMEYTGNAHDKDALAKCSGQIYGNLFKQDFSDVAQNTLIGTIKKCADDLKNRGITYYIVTDDASRKQVESIFGNVAKVI